MASSTTMPARPLDGVRVLELGQLIAGPYAGSRGAGIRRSRCGARAVWSNAHWDCADEYVPLPGRQVRHHRRQWQFDLSAPDAAIAAWTASLGAAEVLQQLEAVSVPAGPIYSVVDMMQDPHFHARGLFQDVEIDGKPLKIPAIPLFLSATPGGTTWPGPAVGAHNREILGGMLGLSAATLAALQREGVI